MDNDVLVYFGGAVKALDDNGKVGGYLVLYGNPQQADLSSMRDYFTANTDFDIEDGAKSAVYFNHGFDPVLKTRKLGRAELRKDEFGVWAETILQQRDEYEKFVFDLVKQGKIGWSSGTLPNLVERKSVGDTHEILKWSLGGDASLTHTPADYRNTAVALKSIPFNPLVTSTQPEAAREAKASAAADVLVNVIEHVKDVGTMADNEQANATPQHAPPDVKALENKVDGLSEQLSNVLKFMQDQPSIKNAGYFTHDGGAADKNIKSLGDFLMAVKRHDYKRLETVYEVKDMAADQSGTGGVLVPTTFETMLRKIDPQTSPIVSRVSRQPVGTPSGRMPALDQYFAPTAGTGETAMAGRVTTAARAEGGAYTETQAQFEEITWLVGDAASGYVEVTKELRADSAISIEALIRNLIGIAIDAKLEYFILRGNGAGQPLGILNSPVALGIPADTNDVFTYADAVEIMTRFFSVGGSPVWICHPSIMTDIAAFTVASGSPVVWATDLASRQPGSLLGAPLIMSQHMPQANGDNPLLADLSAYIQFERGGLYIDYSEHAGFLNGKDTWRFGLRVDGKPWMQNKITLSDPTGSYTQSPFVYHDD